MDEEETVTEPQVPKLGKKELRKQQLMEYLAAKGRLKPPNPKPYLRHGQLDAKKPAMSTVKPGSAKSKENQPPNAANKRNDAQKVQPQNSKGASQPSKTNILGLSANAAQTRKHTIASLKSNPNAIDKPKMQLDMGIKPPVRPSSSKSLSNIPQQTTSQTKYRASWPTGEAKSALQMTCSSRMSLGPLAKTRTSLIPSILQPRTTIPTATTTTSSTANRGHSNNTTRLVSSVAQKSTVARGKPFSFTDGLKHTRTTATGATVADIKTKTLNKTISKPHPVKSLKPSLQNRPPTAFKATSTRSPAAAVKPHQNERATKSIKSVQGGTGNAQPQKVSSGGFSGAGGQRQTTASNRPTAGLKAKDEVHRGADNKSAIDSTKESQQNQPPTPTAFKATCVSTRPTTAPAKPEQKARVPEYTKSVQPSKKASECRSGVEGTGNNPQSEKVGSGGTSDAEGQRQNTVSKRATHTAELTEKDREHGGASDNKREECTSSKRAGVPYVPQATPQRAKSLSSVEWATDTKTPRAQATVMPQTEKHNLTAAQEDRLQKFREWRESKGISYKRPPMHERPPPVRRTVALPQPDWTNKNDDDDDDTRALICAMDYCVGLLEEPLDKLHDVFDILKKRDETDDIQGAAGGTSEAGGQRQNTVSKRATHTAELTEKDRVHGGASDNKREECTSSKRAGVPYVPQAAPQRAKSLSSVEWATDTKTPRAQATVMPQTEKHNLTAAQQDRLQKLREWQESKGISYKRPPMHERPPPVRRTVAVPQPDWTNKNDDDDDFHRALICALDYCVKLMEEPLDKLRDVFDILKKRVDIQGRACTPQELQEDSPIQGQNCSEAAVTPAFTPNPVRACVYSEKSSSSMVKYKVTSTPFPSRKQREPVRVNGQELRFITPVRRSVRIEGASLRYPASLRDHDVCVASYDDLMVQEEQEEDREASSPSIHGTPMYVYVENQALKDKVDVQLFTNDED